MALVCATHADGSMGRTGSCRGMVKYPLGFGSQHLATTNVMGLKTKQTYIPIILFPFYTAKCITHIWQTFGKCLSFSNNGLKHLLNKLHIVYKWYVVINLGKVDLIYTTISMIPFKVLLVMNHNLIKCFNLWSTFLDFAYEGFIPYNAMKSTLLFTGRYVDM